MSFKLLLTSFRERARINKTDLAKKISVTPAYIMLMEKGKQKPPTLAKCQEIAYHLGLTEPEKSLFIDEAMMERITPETREWVSSRDRESRKVMEMLATLRKHKEIRISLDNMIDHFRGISKEQRVEIRKLFEE